MRAEFVQYDYDFKLDDRTEPIELPRYDSFSVARVSEYLCHASERRMYNSIENTGTTCLVNGALLFKFSGLAAGLAVRHSTELGDIEPGYWYRLTDGMWCPIQALAWKDSPTYRNVNLHIPGSIALVKDREVTTCYPDDPNSSLCMSERQFLELAEDHANKIAEKPRLRLVMLPKQLRQGENLILSTGRAV